MTHVAACTAGWHERRDFLRLWTEDGSGRMYFAHLALLGPPPGVYLYQVNDGPTEVGARKVWCYEDKGVPWRCEACGRPIIGGRAVERPTRVGIEPAAATEGAAGPERITTGSGPRVRAKTKSGRTRSDPSPEALVALVRGLDRDDDRFLVVERVDLPGGNHYAQVLIDHDGTWVVERRDGDGRHHRQALTRDRLRVERFLVEWLAQSPNAGAELSWHTLLS